MSHHEVMDGMYPSEDYYQNQADGTMTSRNPATPKSRPPSYGKLRDPRGAKTPTPGNSPKDKY